MLHQFETTGSLRAAGWTARDITRHVADGTLTRVREGRFARADSPTELIRAVRVGGIATSSTAAASVGIWAPPDRRLHVAVRRTSSRLRDPDDPTLALTARDDVCLHWSPGPAAPASRTGVASTLLLLQHGLHCLPPSWAIAMIDSALHERLIRAEDLAALAAGLPRHLALLLDHVDARAESGIESIARVKLRLLGLRVELQVSIAGVGRVDLLVEGRLVIELDGRAFHEGQDHFARDRRRDAAAATARYRVLRFDYAQVLFDWPRVEAAVLAALAA